MQIINQKLFSKLRSIFPIFFHCRFNERLKFKKFIMPIRITKKKLSKLKLLYLLKQGFHYFGYSVFGANYVTRLYIIIVFIKTDTTPDQT